MNRFLDIFFFFFPFFFYFSLLFSSLTHAHTYMSNMTYLNPTKNHFCPWKSMSEWCMILYNANMLLLNFHSSSKQEKREKKKKDWKRNLFNAFEIHRKWLFRNGRNHSHSLNTFRFSHTHTNTHAYTFHKNVLKGFYRSYTYIMCEN